jgi:hypothetical protein
MARGNDAGLSRVYSVSLLNHLPRHHCPRTPRASLPRRLAPCVSYSFAASPRDLRQSPALDKLKTAGGCTLAYRITTLLIQLYRTLTPMQSIINPSDFSPRPAASLSISRGLSIQPSPSGHHLSHYSTQSPYFWLADTAWEAFHRLNKEQVGLYLKNRKEKGFGVVMMVILAEHG